MATCVAAGCDSVGGAARLRLRRLGGAALPAVARVAHEVRGCRVRAWRVALIAAICGVAMSSVAGAETDHGRPIIVARGLDNPRGLVFLPPGNLAVAEAGHAGDVCLGPGLCVGLTGQVVVVKPHHDRQTVLAAGLPSAGGPFAPFGLGGLAVQHEKLFAIVGLNPQAFGNPADYCPDSACLATVTAVQNGSGFLDKLRSLGSSPGFDGFASVGSFDFDYAAANPDPGNPEYAPGDANPFGLSAGPHGGFYAVDAASNTLDYVTRHGEISVLAFIPDPPNHLPIYDAAPTCAARTPNGDVYVGTESNSLWRWDGTMLTQVLSGGEVGQVVGCTADDEGNIYLANLASKIGGSFPNFNEAPFDGSIVKVSPDLTTSYLAQGLNYPTGIALGPDDQLYVTVNGLCPSDLSMLTPDNSTQGGCPASGEVIRLDEHGAEHS